jgi:hypothetical protein
VWAAPAASGGVGIYGIIERVAFEPSEQAPERLRVWGAFAYVDGGIGSAGAVSPVRRGFLYFKLPAANTRQVLVEWNDLKSVAGTGQAVAFGQWMYIGLFRGLDPSVRSEGPPYILESYPGRGEMTDMRVRTSLDQAGMPAVYQMNTGLVRLPAEGSRADLVRQLKQALTTP